MIDNVIQYFETIDPVLGALYASLFTWILTAVGAALVFFVRGMNRALLDGMLGFTGGVMVQFMYCGTRVQLLRWKRVES